MNEIAAADYRANANPVVQTATGPVTLGSEAELAYWVWCKRLGLPEPTPQFQLRISNRVRKYDFGFGPAMLIVEINGGIGDPKMGHSTRRGVADDYAKWAEAVIRGYRVLLFTTEMANDGTATLLTQRALAGNE